MLKDNSAAEYHDGQLFEVHNGRLVEQDASISVCPVSDEDVAALIRLLPFDMLPEVARLVTLRALGLEEVPGLLRSV